MDNEEKVTEVKTEEKSAEVKTEVKAPEVKTEENRRQQLRMRIARRRRLWSGTGI